MNNSNPDLFPPLSTSQINLKEIILPRSQATYTRLSQLYQAESKDFSEMVGTVRDLMLDVNDKLRETTSNINELMKKTAKEEDVKQKAGKFLDAKNEELRNKNKNIESIISGLKETVSNIKPKLLADLPIEKERALNTIFELIFQILYSSSEDKFSWGTFKKKALLASDGEDFQARMANINVKKLPEQTYKDIMALKVDPEFNKICDNQKYQDVLLDLSDWMEYVCKGYEFHNEWRDTQDNYEKIQKNVTRRGLEGTQAKEALSFWKDTHGTTEEFRQFLSDMEARLKAIQLEFQNTAPKLKEAATANQSRFEKLTSD